MDRDDSKLLGRSIHPLGEIIKADPVRGGVSSDRKFKVHFYGYDGAYLLRLFDESEISAKRAEFEALHRMQTMTVRCSKPISMGRWEKDGSCFLLLSYIEGTDAASALPVSSKPQQLRIGIQAGEELRRIGSYDAPEGMQPWEKRRMLESERDLHLLAEAGIFFRGADKAEALVRTGRSRLQSRPYGFLHGGFYPAHLIVQNGRLAGVVNFGHFGWGDPLYEFSVLGLCGREISPLFCTGQILGYHGGQEPDAEFWSLYSLYAAMGMFGYLRETLERDPAGMPEAIARAERLIDDHDGFASDKPVWFAAL